MKNIKIHGTEVGTIFKINSEKSKVRGKKLIIFNAIEKIWSTLFPLVLRYYFYLFKFFACVFENAGIECCLCTDLWYVAYIHISLFFCIL